MNLENGSTDSITQSWRLWSNAALMAGREFCYRGLNRFKKNCFLNLSHFIEQILMEHVYTKLSLDSRLLILTLSSIRIRSVLSIIPNKVTHWKLSQ